MQSTLTAAHVQQLAASILRSTLHLADFGRRCPATTLLAVLFSACCRLCSLFAAARRLVQAPSHETVRRAVLAQLADLATLERRLNQALLARRPARLHRRRWPLAIDLQLQPYHGQPAHHPDELYRGQAKSGTTHFHAYATAYLVMRGQRFTLALTSVRRGEKLERVLQRLLRRCAAVRVKPSRLLVDRGFWTVGVIRYLQAARVPFLLPVIARGRTADQPGGPSGSRVFWSYRRSGWGAYRLQETGGGRTARVQVAVYRRRQAGRRGKRGFDHLVYAYWGWAPTSPRAAHEQYRGRFGIETSYRQLNEARPTTCTRNPAVRLLLVGVALVLRNVWVWLHHAVLSTPRRGGRRYRPERLRFQDLLLLLLHEAERLLGVCDEVATERPIPIDLETTGESRIG